MQRLPSATQYVSQAPLPEPPFHLDSLWPAELLPAHSMQAGPWKHFTSRHEVMQQQEPEHHAPQTRTHKSSASDDSPATALQAEPALDSEAEAAQAWAEAHASSGEEEMQPVPCTADFSNDDAEALQLRVCNGPWSSLHKPTEASKQAFLDSDSADVHLLKPARGCKLSIAAMFVWTSNLHNACTRKGCA